MADLEVDSMTDAELRTKLAMSITASTRKLLVKMMKLVLSEKGKRKISMDPKRDAGPSFARPSDVSKADNIESMSDAEIQAILLDNGYAVMPITASTRNLYINKIKGILEKGKSRSSVGDSKLEGRHSLQRYSSGEESNVDITVKGKRGHRQTTGGAMLPPTAKKARRNIKRKLSPVKMDADKRNSDSNDEKSKNIIICIRNN